MTETPKTPAPAERAGRKRPFRVVATAIAIPVLGVAAIIGLRATDGEESRYAVSEGEPARVDRSADPLVAELARCRTVAAHTVDERCYAAWEAHRRRFYGKNRSAVLPEPGPPAISSTPEGR